MDKFTIFRVLVNGITVEEAIVPDSTPSDDREDVVARIGQQQARTCSAAEAAGMAWQIEAVFSDGEHFRFGSDPAGMVDPEAVPMSQMLDKLAERWQL